MQKTAERVLETLDAQRGVLTHTGDLMQAELEGIMDGWIKERGIVHSVPAVGDLISVILTDETGRAVAVAQVNVRNDKYGLIRAVWTDNKVRGQGLGQKAVSAVVEASLEAGLICTTYSNRSSRKIFQNLGFSFGEENRIEVAFGTLKRE